MIRVRKQEIKRRRKRKKEQRRKKGLLRKVARSASASE